MRGFDSEILETTEHAGKPEQVKTNLGSQQYRIATAAQHEISETPATTCSSHRSDCLRLAIDDPE
jgi:hypothetical protein